MHGTAPMHTALPSVWRVFLLGLLGQVASSCVLIRAARSNELLEQIATVKGSVKVSPPPGATAFVTILRKEDSGWRLHSSRVATGPEPFEFYGPPGDYQLFAFVDLNANRAWEPGESSARSQPRMLAAGQVVEEPALLPAADGPASPVPLTVELGSTSAELVKVHRGDLANLEEERFSEEAAKMAYWQPAEFALKYGVGVSFLEPYDPRKIPVLFVHGAAGSPQNFAPLIAAMDRSRFQPWVFSYPSGIRLDFATVKLQHLLDDLHLRLKFERLLVVGHSMGGLVARALALRVAARTDRSYVRLLVTIAAPFKGHEAAKAGVEASPVVLPSWRDLAAGSPFLLSLRSPLPASTPHHLFFSYVGGSAAAGPTDGTISLRSMLDSDVQMNTAHLVGFPESHDSILSSPAVIGELNASLRRGAEVEPPGSP